MMKKHIPVVVLWLVNSLVIYLLGAIFPKTIVLGNEFINPLVSSLVMGLLITALDHLGKHANKYRFKLKGKYLLLTYYFIVNTIAFWLLARIPFITGYGIARFYWAILLGMVITATQWLTRQWFKKSKLI